MKESERLPELFKVNDLNTYAEWFSLMEEYGHICFYIDGQYYFLFPEGPHKYGLCLGEDEKSGNRPRWEFNSEDEFLNAPMFGGKSILDRLDDVWAWDLPFFGDGDEEDSPNA